jgi:L-ascorbate metabolism protein UlaG (beta-lactamase superfamily)
MQWNRRKFLKGSFAIAGFGAVSGGLWARSNAWSARWFRQLIAESNREILPADVEPDPAEWSNDNITICWIGHATVLINFYGLNILTDPVLGNKIGLGVGPFTIGPKRLVQAALKFKELPRIDLILLSHAHMDHMDLGSLKRFKSTTPIITSKDTTDVLKQIEAQNVTEMDWRDKTVFKSSSGAGELEVSAFEVKHWGRRPPSKRDRGYNGYVLRREGKAILFGGDTANTPQFAELRSQGPFEAAIMPIGAYDPWIRNHCTPEEAFEMVNAAGAKFMIPMHHQGFRLSREGFNEPIERLQQAMKSEPERLALKRVGEHFVCPVV